MRLHRIQVTNLRCVHTLCFDVREYTTLIGPNNSGKSTMLRAIDLLLGQGTPAPDEWCAARPGEPIVIEGSFDQIKDWEKMRPGVASHVYNAEIRIRVTLKRTKDEKGVEKTKTLWESFREDESFQGWTDGTPFTKLDKAFQDFARGKGIDPKKFGTEYGKEELRAHLRAEKPEWVTKGEATWSSDGISIPAALKQALPQALYIPAVRDASDDGEPGAKTSFGLILDKIVLPAVKSSTEFANLLAAVDALDARIRGTAKDGSVVDQLAEVKVLAASIGSRLGSIMDAKVHIGLDPPDAEKFVGANALLHLDDGAKTRIGLQGHGLQRMLIFAMLEVLAEQEARTDSGNGERRQTVLLFEEPELYLHPHLIRRLKTAMEAIAKSAGWQVVITTHSPLLVDVATDPRSLVIHRRSESSTPPVVSQLRVDPFEGVATGDTAAEERRQQLLEERSRLQAALSFHPTVCEAFFAKHAVLVEGDSELAVLNHSPIVLDLAGVPKEQSRDVTVVSCDGKLTIRPIARLLSAFGIPFRVIHDRDMHGKTLEQLIEEKSHPFHENARIASLVPADRCHVIDDTLEDVLFPPEQRRKSAKDKPFRAWRQVGLLCTDKSDLDHAPGLRDLVRFAFSPFPAVPPVAGDASPSVSAPEPVDGEVSESVVVNASGGA
jgi:energy-coupling factor transporter ATP-binding protein EcfA2